MKKADYHRKRPGVLVRFQGDQIVRVKEAAARECLAVETWMRQKALIAANMTVAAPLLDGVQSKRLAKMKKKRLAVGGVFAGGKAVKIRMGKKAKVKKAPKHGGAARPGGDRKKSPMTETPAPAAAAGSLVKPG